MHCCLSVCRHAWPKALCNSDEAERRNFSTGQSRQSSAVIALSPQQCCICDLPFNGAFLGALQGLYNLFQPSVAHTRADARPSGGFSSCEQELTDLATPSATGYFPQRFCDVRTGEFCVCECEAVCLLSTRKWGCGAWSVPHQAGTGQLCGQASAII